MGGSGPRAPLPLRLAVRALPEEVREEVLGDLLEKWHGEVRGRPLHARALWLARQPLLALRLRMRHGADRERRRGVHATTRAGLGFSWLDVKLGLRMLAKQPTLTIVGGLTLAFGIPVGLFPWHMTRIMVQPLPVDEAERIQAIRYIDTEEVDYMPPSIETFERLRESLSSFESIGVTTMAMSLNVTTGGSSAPEWGAQVTASMFGTLRVAPLLGRTLIDGDEVPGASPVAVISSDLWQSRLASDPDVIGTTIEVGGVPHTVVGVMPEGFHYPYQDDVWIPVRVRELVDESRADWGPGHLVFGRLVDGVSLERAQAEFAAVHRALVLESPDAYERLEPEVVPFTAGMFNDPPGGVWSNPEFFTMQFFFLMVLVVACTNVGMLTLARASIRSSELAVRTALGASRARIVSQLFIESLVLAVLAASFGLAVGQWVVLPALLSAFGETFPRWFNVGASPETVAWALSLAALSAGVVGVVPALKATGKSVHRNIQRAAVDRSGIRFGGLSSTLLVVDVALTVSVLGVAGMFYSSVSESVRRGPAIASDEFLYAQVSLPRIAFTEGGARFDADDFTARTREAQLELMRRLREEPGVRGVALGSSVIRMRGTAIELDDGPGGGVRRGSLSADVDADFFSALGHPVTLGRDFTPADAEQGTAVIINQSFVDLVLGGSNPLGRRLRYAPRNEEPGPWLEIVGVVDDITMNESSPGNDRGFYRAAAAGAMHPLQLAIHLDDEPEAFARRLRTIAAEVDATATVSNTNRLDRTLFANRAGWMLALAGGGFILAVLVGLSAAGIYALMSFTVSERTREIGIRIALGAGRGNVVRAVATRALVQIGLGGLIGVPIVGMLFTRSDGMRESLPGALTAGLGMSGAVMLVVATLACTAPTLRALRIQPDRALRNE